jgi:hypothetical protein
MANRKSIIAKTATQALAILWEEGFLRAWRKRGAIEVHLAAAIIFQGQNSVWR